MSIEEAFLAAVYERPDDDTPRLVYADWLEDRGQLPRAELIRLQCRIAVGPHSEEDEDRACALVERHCGAWTAHLPQSGAATWQFRRGFPEELEIELAVLLQQWETWSAVPRVRYLTLFGTTAYLLRSFAERRWSPDWVVLRLAEEPKPWLHEQPIDPSSGVRAMVMSPQAAGLRELYFDCHGLGEGGLGALCESPQLGRLAALGVDAPYLTEPRLVARFGKRLCRSSPFS